MPRLETPAVTYADVEAASARLEGRIHRTPVVTSATCDRRTGAEAFFKCENLQRAGSFKIRGAYNAIARLLEASPEDARRGVLAYSSGNHGQAIALAGSLLGVPTTVIMPRDAPEVKISATRGYGAEILLYDRFATTREELAREIREERRLTLIPGYDHADVIAGQGTGARELLEEVAGLDLLLVCLGGGGLLSGCAIAARALAPACRIVGVEPALADDAARSFHTGTLHTVENSPTIADGARTPSLGRLTFPLVLDLVDDVVTVSERAIVSAMRFLWERQKLVVEPTGALAAAALLDGVVEARGKRVGITLSGGNVDLGEACRLFESQRD